MWWTLPFAIFLVTADGPSGERDVARTPRLVIVPNASTILQGDHLLVMVLVENPTTDEIRIFPDKKMPVDGYLRLLIRFGDGWSLVRSMREERDGGGFGVASESKGRVVLGESTYAEFKVIQRQKSSFVFDRPGKFELLAAVRTASGVMESKPVEITVEARSESDIHRAEEIASKVSGLELGGLRWVEPDYLAGFRDLGGNIGRRIENALLLRDFTAGKRIDGRVLTPQDLPEFLRTRFDRVSWEYSLLRLAHFYEGPGDWNAVRQVLAPVPHDSFERRGSLNLLRTFGNPLAIPAWIREDLGKPGTEVVESD